MQHLQGKYLLCSVLSFSQGHRECSVFIVPGVTITEHHCKNLAVLRHPREFDVSKESST